MESIKYHGFYSSYNLTNSLLTCNLNKIVRESVPRAYGRVENGAILGAEARSEAGLCLYFSASQLGS